MKQPTLLLLLSLLNTPTCLAQNATSSLPTTEEIVRSLNPSTAVETRSLRGIRLVPGQETSPPSIDLTINFPYDSIKLGGEELLILKRLGTALQDSRLASFSFKIAGHTDAKGSSSYNLKLSEARANATRDHLIFFYDIDPSRLTSVGYGRDQLVMPADPENGANRRVQIINIGRLANP